MAAISMIVFPGEVLESAQQGIALWANSVLPALLPFFICADFMLAIGIPAIVGSFLEKPFKKIFGTPGSSAFVFVVSIFSGYPMGARIIGQMRRRNEISDREGIGMLSFCSTSGPLFMLGTVGAGMLRSPEAGALIALSHYASAIINGILLRFLQGKDSGGKSYSKPCQKEILSGEKSVIEILTYSIISSLKTLGIICSYIIIFTYITDLMEISGLLDSFTSDHSKGFVKGLMEMTVGLNELSLADGMGLRMKCTLASFLIAFGGFSVMAQSLSVLSGLKISRLAYLLIKLSQALIASSISYFLAPHILNRAAVSVASVSGFKKGVELGFLLQLLFSAKMIIIVVSIFLCTMFADYLLSSRKENSD